MTIKEVIAFLFAVVLIPVAMFVLGMAVHKISVQGNPTCQCEQ